MQSGFVCKLQASLLAQPMVEENKHDYEIKFTKRTLGSTKPSIISMKRAQDKNCCTWRKNVVLIHFNITHVGHKLEEWKKYDVVTFCDPILNFTPWFSGPRHAWHRVFSLEWSNWRVPSVHQVFLYLWPWEEPNPQAQVISRAHGVGSFRWRFWYRKIRFWDEKTQKPNISRTSRESSLQWVVS